MATDPIGATGTTTQATTQSQASSSTSATDAFGLGFDDLLKIVLTQLTYQDPLKPMENFEFVSQLAQFSQIQQTQETNTALQTLVTAQASSQAAGLLGKTVDIGSSAGTGALTGKVSAVTFDQSGPTITITTTDNQTISNLSLSSIVQIRETN